MILFCLVTSALAGLSLGLSLSVGAIVPAAAAIATFAYACAPTVLGDTCPLTAATACVALLDIAALFGLAARLGLIDHRNANDGATDTAQAGRT